jgi:hypothetical protein
MTVYQIWWRDASEVSGKKLEELHNIHPPEKITYGEIVRETKDLLYVAKEMTLEDGFWERDYDVTIIPKSLVFKREKVGE